MSPYDGAETWLKPSPGILKINVDAALFAASNSFGVACLALDDSGLMVEGLTRHYNGSLDPTLAEAIGV